MIYYTTLSLTLVEGHEAQGIDEAIAQGLNDLSGEAGQLVLLEDVITTPIAGEHPVVCVTILAKPLKIEAQEEKQDDFWKNFYRDLTLNERRRIFAKLAEHLGIAIDEHGESEDEGVKKVWTLEEAKAVLAPYRRIDLS